MERWKILHSAKDLKQKKRNVKRSADVSGNARHFCDGELNFTRMWGRKTEDKKELTVWALFGFIEFQIIHTVNDFSQSLLDILESRVMKRMSINHCAGVDATSTSSTTQTHQTDPITGRFFYA